MNRLSYVISYLALAAATAVSAPAMAQSAGAAAAAPAPALDEVVVTARKRDETSIAVPVAITAFGAKQLTRQGVRSFDDLAMLTPSLSVSQVSGGVGGSIVLRGVGTAAGTNPSFDQTVSVNVDGVQVSRGNALRLGQIDMQSVEILRGPQALFFGKNSPAGVISVKTADPTDTFDVMVRAQRQFHARQTDGDFVISGPILSTLKARLALSMSDTDGWLINDANKALGANAIVAGAVTPAPARGPNSTFKFARATVLWDPTANFQARGKFSFAENEGLGFQQGGFQVIYCPLGAAQTAGQATALNGGVANPALAAALAVDDCRANGHYAQGGIAPSHLVPALGANSSDGGLYNSQSIGSLELNYRPAPELKLTSVTGIVHLIDRHFDSFSFRPSDAVTALDFRLRSGYSALTEEARLATDFKDSPVNALVGAFVERSDFATYVHSFPGSPPLVDQFIKGETNSVFAQGTWNISEQLELAGGARWTRETKSYRVTRADVVLAQAVSKASFDNVSPEATLTWRPTSKMTVYGAYKQGFKSGGFAAPFTSSSTLATMVGANNSYRPERAKGGEAGFKALLLDGGLRVNLAAYHYKYTDLQVNSLDNSTGIPVIKVTNAAQATNQGVEADATWRPEFYRDVELHGELNYNDAKYDRFLGGCYIGQTVAMGCDRGLNPATGRFTAQSLAGKPLLNAPKWNASVGFNLDREVGSTGLRMGLSSDLSYKTSYTPHPDEAPGALQKAATFVNAGLRIYNDQDGWGLALIGKNLGDVYRVTTSSNVPATGNGTLTGSVTPGGLADLTGFVNRGREISLQLTLYPAKWMH